MLSVEDNGKLTITIELAVIGIENSNELLLKLKETAAAYNKDVVLDMKNVSSMDSSAIASLVKFYKYLVSTKNKVTIANLSPDLRDTLKIMHVSRFFGLQ